MDNTEASPNSFSQATLPNVEFHINTSQSRTSIEARSAAVDVLIVLENEYIDSPDIRQILESMRPFLLKLREGSHPKIELSFSVLKNVIPASI